MYDTPEDILREIQAGEDSLIDFKELRFKGKQIRFKSKDSENKASVECAKDLCCFANSEGGVILYGVRDDGERLGIPREKIGLLQQFILDVAQNNVEPPLGHLLMFDKMMLPDSTGTETLCLKLEIRKARFNIHAPRGKRPFWRLADRCHKMTLEQQARLFERRGMMIPFEERPVYSAEPQHLNMEYFQRYYEMRYGSLMDDSAISTEQLLQNIKILVKDETGGLHPTVMGMLLFGFRPEQWITGAYSDIAVYERPLPDADFQVDAKSVSGTLIRQIETIMEYLRVSPYLPIRATKNEYGRLDQPAYSLRALQEALVNALVHRDYTIQGSQTRIFIFPDRIEISNPGKLHNTLTPENLFAGCQPVRRNQMLAGFLREYQSPLTQRSYMEGRGEGFLMMVRECKKISGILPQVDVIGDSVKVTIFRRNEFVDIEKT